MVQEGDLISRVLSRKYFLKECMKNLMLIVVGLFFFIFYWNDFMGPLIYLNSDKKFTVAIGLQFFKGMRNPQWNLLMAASTVVLFSAIIIFLSASVIVSRGLS